MIKNRMGSLAIAALAMIAGLPPAALGQEGLIAPRAMTSPQPPQPTNAAGTAVEGWVTVRYSVTADGKAADVRAINFMPPTIDPAATVTAVEGWTFFPGMRDGQAIDWHNNETVVTFRSQSGLPEGGAEFEESYTEIWGLIEDSEYQQAHDANTRLLQEQSLRLVDIGLALAQAAAIRNRASDFHAALGPAQMATDPRVPMLGGADLFAALQMRMQIEAQLGRLREALKSYNRLVKGIGPSTPDPAFLQVGEELSRRAATTEFLEVSGLIGNSPWRIDAGRPFFYIEDIDGSIQSIDAECDTRKLSLEFQSDADYQLPETFGNCTLFVNGSRGTDFSFIEVLPQSE